MMSGLKFRSTFCAVGLGLGRQPAAWQALFAAEHTDFSRDASAVLILYDDSIRCTLLVEPLLGQFALSWEVRHPPSGNHLAVIPRVDGSRMNAFEYTEHGDPVPAGSLVDPVTAGVIARAFLERPETPPPDVVEWFPRDAVTWPHV